MSKKVLILGGGVAGVSLAYYLGVKGYKTTIIEEKGNEVGGLSRTYYYNGHSYEFGPHVWFWPDPSPENELVREFTNNELYYIDRKLFSQTDCGCESHAIDGVSNDGLYRYPIHFEDVLKMPDKEKILKELMEHRDDNFKLKLETMPIIGQCTFKEYFTAALGKTLYTKFMKDYTHKMWNIPGEDLQTSMVWADILKHHYKKLEGYDPLKFKDHTLGSDINFQIYPKAGWNVVWGKMAAGAEIIKGKVTSVKGNPMKVCLSGGREIDTQEYDRVISTLPIDSLMGCPNLLPYNGRMMILLLLPRHSEGVFPVGAESLHFSGAEFQTRVTDIDVITGYRSDSRLLLVEVPITQEISEKSFPKNVIENAKNKNLFIKRAYAQQSKEGLEKYQMLLEKSKKEFPKLLHSGRQAEFRYTSMPETVSGARILVEENF